MVSSFYSSGTIMAHKWVWESEANILVMGIRNPFKLKIEISHPWGQPILHILIDDTRLEVLSFSENRLYLGTLSSELISRFFPVDFNHDLIWAALRGYPHLLGHRKISKPRRNQINFFDGNGKVIEVIDLHPDSLNPRRVFYPEKQINLIFSGFRESEGGILYPLEVSISSIKGKGSLNLKNRNMVFNKNIPEQVFTIKKPPMFETVFVERTK